MARAILRMPSSTTPQQSAAMTRMITLIVGRDGGGFGIIESM
jgi:hypothetical protein